MREKTPEKKAPTIAMAGALVDARDELTSASGFLAQAGAKVEAEDLNGALARVVFAQRRLAEAQRRLADFTEEFIACPKNEGGYPDGVDFSTFGDDGAPDLDPDWRPISGARSVIRAPVNGQEEITYLRGWLASQPMSENTLQLVHRLIELERRDARNKLRTELSVLLTKE